MKTVLTTFLVGAFAVLAGGLVAAAFDRTAGILVVVGIIVLAALIARENHSRKMNGEPSLIGRRRDEDSPTKE